MVILSLRVYCRIPDPEWRQSVPGKSACRTVAELAESVIPEAEEMRLQDKKLKLLLSRFKTRR